MNLIFLFFSLNKVQFPYILLLFFIQLGILWALYQNINEIRFILVFILLADVLLFNILASFLPHYFQFYYYSIHCTFYSLIRNRLNYLKEIILLIGNSFSIKNNN